MDSMLPNSPSAAQPEQGKSPVSEALQRELANRHQRVRKALRVLDENTSFLDPSDRESWDTYRTQAIELLEKADHAVSPHEVQSVVDRLSADTLRQLEENVGLLRAVHDTTISAKAGESGQFYKDTLHDDRVYTRFLIDLPVDAQAFYRTDQKGDIVIDADGQPITRLFHWRLLAGAMNSPQLQHNPQAGSGQDAWTLRHTMVGEPDGHERPRVTADLIPGSNLEIGCYGPDGRWQSFALKFDTAKEVKPGEAFIAQSVHVDAPELPPAPPMTPIEEPLAQPIAKAIVSPSAAVSNDAGPAMDATPIAPEDGRLTAIATDIHGRAMAIVDTPVEAPQLLRSPVADAVLPIALDALGEVLQMEKSVPMEDMSTRMTLIEEPVPATAENTGIPVASGETIDPPPAPAEEVTVLKETTAPETAVSQPTVNDKLDQADVPLSPLPIIDMLSTPLPSDDSTAMGEALKRAA